MFLGRTGLLIAAISICRADSTACAGCHADVWKSYSKSGMARSFSQVADRAATTFYHPASDIWFAMVEHDGRYFQQQYQIDANGKRINASEKQVDFVLGSGNHSKAFLHRTPKNTLIELPLAWYAENGGTWAMNPGYDRPDHQGFGRRIGYDCMFCHNAYPEIPNGSGPRTEPVYSTIPLGIDCQRCHGVGTDHIALAKTPGASRDAIRKGIVNPSRLSPDRQMELCMQCHLETTSSPLPNAIVRYERRPFSYRPGEPLSDFVLHFDHVPGSGHDDKFEIAGAAYRLRKSQCFLKSDGALRCTSCHNPHDPAARNFTAACRQCHGAMLDREVATKKHTASTDCVGCHMPKHTTDDAIHVSMTDHFIQRQPAAASRVAKERTETYRGEVVPYYPPYYSKSADEIYRAIAQVSESSNLDAGIAMLAAALERERPAHGEYYLQLGDALRNRGRLTEALPIYEDAVRRDPKSLAAMQRLALCLTGLKQHARAIALLKQSPTDAESLQLIGLNYVEQGNTGAARQAFERAIELAPEAPEIHNSLGGLLLQFGERALAEAALRRALRIRPNYAEARNNLGSVLLAWGRIDEARVEFQAALRYKPGYALAHQNDGLALAKMGRFPEAQSELEQAIREDPSSPEAHHLLGYVLGTQGNAVAALTHFREAVRLNPEFYQANLDLGSALMEAGEKQAAIPYLRKAAQSQDSQIRTFALAMLRKITP